MKVAIIVPGWPSTQMPYFMPFFYEQVKSIAQYGSIKIDVYIESSVLARFKLSRLIKRILHGRDDYLKFDCADVNLIEVKYINNKMINKFRLIETSFIAICCKKIRQNEFQFGEYDIVHAHFFSCALVAHSYFIETGRQYIITEHASDIDLAFGSHDETFISEVYSEAKRVISVSELLRTKLRLRLGVSLDITVIPNGIDFDIFKFKHDNIDASRELISFIFVGHLIERKGVMKLLVAVRKLMINGYKVNLSIVGEGYQSDSIREYIDENNMDNVRLLGAMNNQLLPSCLHLHDCLVLPSEKESFGVVVAEAGACGLPVVTSRCGGPEEIVDHADMGVTYSLEDQDGLYEALEYICLNLGTFNPKVISLRTEERFSWQYVVPRILSQYGVDL